METISYWGQQKCQLVKKNGIPCSNIAYYSLEGKLVCGMHSAGKKKEHRVELAHDPMEKEKKADELENHKRSCEERAEANSTAKKHGAVELYKMRMMKSVGYVKGAVNIFPNYKHGKRVDGLGFPSLSPKSIGPVLHPQPGLPVCLNLENFHQGNKVFPTEVDEKGDIREEFFETQRKMYGDAIPHRHKEAAGGKNVPRFSLWKDKDNVEHRISYFESRQFYCVYYERATKENPDFLRLKKMIEDGYDLRICGYDAYDVGDMSLEECYCDVSRPFGHELVLYSMLVGAEEDWPWRKYKTFDF